MIPLQGLLPLEGTMPGWPEAPETNIASTLFIIFAIPLIIGLIVALLCKGQELRQRSMENGVAVGLPASNPRLAIEGSDHDEDSADRAAIDSAEPDNQVGSRTV